MATLARDLPSVRDFAVWNEPNLNGFWLYQFDESGNDIAAPAYTSLLARSYDALKAVSPKIRVYGGSLAPRGADNPESHRGTRSLRPRSSATWAAPTAPAGGRSRSWTSSRSIRTSSAPRCRRAQEHPGERRSASPTTTSSSRLLGEAFDGTAQPGLGAADRVHGVRRPGEDPRERPGARTRTSTPPSDRTRSTRQTQAQLLPRGARARRLPADGDRASLLPPDRRGRPEPMAVRPLLRGHEAEVEPPGDQGSRGEGSRGEARHLFVKLKS